MSGRHYVKRQLLWRHKTVVSVEWYQVLSIGRLEDHLTFSVIVKNLEIPPVKWWQKLPNSHDFMTMYKREYLGMKRATETKGKLLFSVIIYCQHVHTELLTERQTLPRVPQWAVFWKWTWKICGFAPLKRGTQKLHDDIWARLYSERNEI